MQAKRLAYCLTSCNPRNMPAADKGGPYVVAFDGTSNRLTLKVAPLAEALRITRLPLLRALRMHQVHDWFLAHYDVLKDFAGPIVSLLGIAAATIAAICGFRSFERWKREQLEERRIDVALEGLAIARETKYVFARIRDPTALRANGGQCLFAKAKVKATGAGEAQLSRRLCGLKRIKTFSTGSHASCQKQLHSLET